MIHWVNLQVRKGLRDEDLATMRGIAEGQYSGVAVRVACDFVARAAMTDLSVACNGPGCTEVEDRATFKACARCLGPKYCSRDCQKRDWAASHRARCVATTAAATRGAGALGKDRHAYAVAARRLPSHMPELLLALLTQPSISPPALRMSVLLVCAPSHMKLVAAVNLPQDLSTLVPGAEHTASYAAMLDQVMAHLKANATRDHIPTVEISHRGLVFHANVLAWRPLLEEVTRVFGLGSEEREAHKTQLRSEALWGLQGQYTQATSQSVD